MSLLIPVTNVLNAQEELSFHQVQNVTRKREVVIMCREIATYGFDSKKCLTMMMMTKDLLKKRLFNMDVMTQKH